MRTHIPSVVMLLLAGLGGTTCAPPPRALPSPVAELAAVERTFDFRTIEVRAARRTTASGINEGGLIVGYFEDAVVAPSAATRTDDIGQAMFERFVMPFEVVSIVLLAALIGGIVLARRDPTEESEALR